MKQTFKLFSMLAAVALTLVACKPDPVEPTDVERNIVYTVDQTTTTVHLNTEAEFDALLDRFCDYAESGSTVTFYNANSVAKGSTKDATHFSTTNREEMRRWMRRMENEGRTVTISYDSSTGTYNGMAYTPGPQPQSDWVDLGLPSGLLWAKCNIGASQPEDYGNYYAWGEIQTKSEYSWYTYSHGFGYNYLTKYCNMSDFGYNGFTDTLTILEPNDDAATSILDSNAHIPTESEWNELIQYCTGEWTSLNGVGGYRFTGPNGNSIFLPAAGHRDSSDPSIVGEGMWGTYWSADLNIEFPSSARNFHFISEDYETNIAEMTYDGRYHGLSVRAVRAVRSAK